MNILLSIISKLAIAFVVINIIGFILYFFELDTAAIKKFEPAFRKKQDAYIKKKGLE